MCSSIFPSSIRSSSALALAVALAPLAASAGRPLSTEDASVVEHGHCQLEAWSDRFRGGGWEAWLVPACNAGLGIEWQAGAARAGGAGERSGFSQAYAQAKWLFPTSHERFATGAVVGLTRLEAEHPSRAPENPYAALVATASIGAASLHVNIGHNHEREARRRSTTWGLAIERPLGERWTVLAESFGDDRGRPFVRAGATWAIVPGLAALDLSVVGRRGGEARDRLVSLGIFLSSPRLLP